ncbi:phage virion morphogenesis protein [uncultured Desulfovibrio sp.]|uniref:phage virion morphogenesis protein n=1 Tax=uncultured Desulfovibrio sp. TaxID=167968 RepID=UPI00260D4801|nr:phage virion morphogenesis protein [uncultured Desulfovibrio sp.]
MRQLSETMIAAAQRTRKGRSALNILQDSGMLVGSIGRTGMFGIHKVGPLEAIVGTNVPYAAAHQFGVIIRRKAAPMRVRLRVWKGANLFATKRHKRVRVVGYRARGIRNTYPGPPFSGWGRVETGEFWQDDRRLLRLVAVTVA